MANGRLHVTPRMGDDAAMPGQLIHIGINAADPAASRAFYANVIGWTFEPWGPPGFSHIIGTGLPAAALQQRRDLDGTRVTGFECTVAVDDVGAAIAAAVSSGGRVLMEPTVIAGVGELAWVADPDGNPLGLMRQDATAS